MRDTLVIDLETKKSFDEVGGEKNIADLGISVAGVWSYAQDAFFALEEHELPVLTAAAGLILLGLGWSASIPFLDKIDGLGAIPLRCRL